jgi:hypothetical protein
MELNRGGVPAAAATAVQCRRDERAMTASGSTIGSGSMSDSDTQWRGSVSDGSICLRRGVQCGKICGH